MESLVSGQPRKTERVIHFVVKTLVSVTLYILCRFIGSLSRDFRLCSSSFYKRRFIEKGFYAFCICIAPDMHQWRSFDAVLEPAQQNELISLLVFT